MMEECGVSVDHSSINRWAVRFLPLIEKIARKHKRPLGCSWLMDETYSKVKLVWKYLYLAIDKQGKTVDFLLTAKRDVIAAKRFFDKTMRANGDPEKVAVDKSGANKAAIDATVQFQLSTAPLFVEKTLDIVGGCILIRQSGPWCFASTRKARFKRSTGLSRFFP